MTSSARRAHEPSGKIRPYRMNTPQLPGTDPWVRRNSGQSRGAGKNHAMNTAKLSTLLNSEDYAKPGRMRNRRTLVLDIEKPGDTPD